MKSCRIIRLLSYLSGMVRGDELVHALAKVKSFIPADKAKDIELKVNQINIDLSPWMGNRTIQPYLEMIKTALEERKLLTFGYIARHGNKNRPNSRAVSACIKKQSMVFAGVLP